MNIRTADASDTETLINLRMEYLREEFSEFDYDPDEVRVCLRDYFSRHIGNDFTAYFAEVDGRTASVIFLLRLERPANPHFLTGKTAMLMNVYTLEDYRRRGIAETLLNKVISDAKEEGISSIDLTATDMGRPLYLKAGFKERENSNRDMRLRL